MRFSNFAKSFSADSGIFRLMDDIGAALASDKEIYMLGGGNPSAIPQMQKVLRQRMAQVLANGAEFDRMVGNYDGPQGNTVFINALATLLQAQFGCPIKSKNIAITNGSQTSFYVLFNLFAGRFDDINNRKILLPLTPEYIGYTDLGLDQRIFSARRPDIEHIDETTFKYHVNFNSLNVTDEIGAICVSRPTNPTGNVLTDTEVEKLVRIANKRDIPLILDSAYGTPFPNIIFSNATPIWNDRIVYCMSLSKLGMPGTRCGIIIAHEDIIQRISGANAVLSLAPGSFGPTLAQEMVRSGEIISLSQNIIRPFYQQKAQQAAIWLRDAFQGYPFKIHKPEGAIFLWLWFENLPITVEELYQRLKNRGVLVIAGQHFFPGLEDSSDEPWRHKHECIRVTYAQEDTMVKRGIEIIADEVKKIYDNATPSASAL